jgi:hypothetical protein
MTALRALAVELFHDNDGPPGLRLLSFFIMKTAFWASVVEGFS